MKRGPYLVNTARGKICDRDAVVRALESGQLAGYAGDVWFPQPAPQDHPWRTMPHHGMTPHISGTSLSAQARYAAGTREILECFFDGRPIREEYLIVDGGQPGGHRRPLLWGGQRHLGLGGGRAVQPLNDRPWNASSFSARATSRCSARQGGPGSAWAGFTLATPSRPLYYSDGLGGRSGNWVDGTSRCETRPDCRDGNHGLSPV